MLDRFATFFVSQYLSPLAKSYLVTGNRIMVSVSKSQRMSLDLQLSALATIYGFEFFSCYSVNESGFWLLFDEIQPSLLSEMIEWENNN